MSAELLGVTADTMLRPIQYRGLQGFCTGWAGDREGTVYASLIGRVTAVTGIWAAFQDNNALKITHSQYLSKLPKLDGAKYHTLRVRLPESDWLHLVLLHTQATMHNLPNLPFYILSTTEDPPLEAFWVQWNNALPLPAFQEWSSRLWELGYSNNLISHCRAEGTICWKVKVVHKLWQRIIQRIVEERPLSTEI